MRGGLTRLEFLKVSGAGAAALAFAGCGGSSGGGGGGGEAVTIGYSGPLSGGAARYGENVLNGIQMAVDEINEAGGVEVDGTQMTLAIESLDDRYLPNESATNARRLVQQEGTPIIFIPHSGGILAAQEINTERNPFVIGAYSSIAEILEADNPLTVMIPPLIDNYMQPFAEKEMSEFGNRLGLVPTTSDYGQTWTEQITAVWEEKGGEVLSNNGFDYSTSTEYAGPVTQALSEDPDVLFVGGPSQPTALVIEQARQQGFEGGFIVMDQAKFEEMEAFTSIENLNGSVGVLPLLEYDAPGTEEFVNYYRERFGDERPPTSEVGLNYQAMHIFARAMEITGSTDDPETIMGGVDQAAGEIEDQFRVYLIDSMTEEGHLTGPVIATYVENGEYTELEVPQEQ